LSEAGEREVAGAQEAAWIHVISFDIALMITSLRVIVFTSRRVRDSMLADVARKGGHL